MGACRREPIRCGRPPLHARHRGRNVAREPHPAATLPAAHDGHVDHVRAQNGAALRQLPPGQHRVPCRHHAAARHAPSARNGRPHDLARDAGGHLVCLHGRPFGARVARRPLGHVSAALPSLLGRHLDHLHARRRAGTVLLLRAPQSFVGRGRAGHRDGVRLAAVCQLPSDVVLLGRARLHHRQHPLPRRDTLAAARDDPHRRGPLPHGRAHLLPARRGQGRHVQPDELLRRASQLQGHRWAHLWRARLGHRLRAAAAPQLSCSLHLLPVHLHHLGRACQLVDCNDGGLVRAHQGAHAGAIRARPRAGHFAAALPPSVWLVAQPATTPRLGRWRVDHAAAGIERAL
mmetsp:Transcript_70599/g.212325  ORF Transcript_70599/g.212325 Transcript_70599/m.212325 type:complete len:346 (-) Transcript_70599:626-1663(-)